jgi:hypothetical protein
MARLPPVLAPLWPSLKRVYTAGTRQLAPANQRLSRAAGGWLPQSVNQTVDDAVAAGAGRMWEVFDPQELVRAAPLGLPADEGTLAAQARELVPRVVIAELPGGRVLGRHRGVITARGAFIAELSTYFATSSPLEHPLFLNPFPGAPATVAGSLGVLACRGDHSYYHFLLDVLPRLAILEACADAPTVERWYAPASHGFQRELLELAGIAAERVIDSDARPHVRAERLVVPSLPDPDLKTPPWAVQFLRERLMRDAPSARRPLRRIYVTRGEVRNSRIVRNEAEVIGLLHRHGFELVDPGRMTVREQIAMFAAAELIVAPHGGALGNLAFVNAGAGLIELFAPDYVQGCYWKLIAAVPGTRYRYLIGRGERPRNGAMWGVASDIDVDLGALSQLLDELV